MLHVCKSEVFAFEEKRFSADFRKRVGEAVKDFTGIWFLREMESLREWLGGRDGGFVTAAEMARFVRGMDDSRWVDLLKDGLCEYVEDVGEGERGVDFVLEWLAEWSRSVRERVDGVLLLTAHRAKGLQFEHVFILDGGWDRVASGEDAEASRRLYYVAMTRAMKTLTLLRRSDRNAYVKLVGDEPAVLERTVDVEEHVDADLIYRRLSLSDVFLSWPGYKGAGHPVHRWISELRDGDELVVRAVGRGSRYGVFDLSGRQVSQLASRFSVPRGRRIRSASVLAVVVWGKDYSDNPIQDEKVPDVWEVVLPEIIFE